MRIGITIPCASDPVATDYSNVSRYAVETMLYAKVYGIQTYLASDGANSTKATRQNTRHLNLAILCSSAVGGHGVIYYHPDTSTLNRTRAMKMATSMAGILGYSFAVEPANDIEEMREYKAFCWRLHPLYGDPQDIASAIVDSLRYAYE